MIAASLALFCHQSSFAKENAAPVAVSSSVWQAQIMELGGSVQFKAEESDSAWTAAETLMPLDEGDMLKTGPDGFARVLLDGEAVVELGSSTVLTVGNLAYSASNLSLRQGSLLGKIKNLFSRQRSFEVRTPAAVCAVRGTEFGVEHDADGETVAGVFDDGEIAVGWGTSPDADRVSVKSGQEAVIGRAPRIKAEAMRRLFPRKARLARIRGDLPAMQKSWRYLPPGERALLRQKLLERRRAAPQKAREAVKARQGKQLARAKAQADRKAALAASQEAGRAKALARRRAAAEGGKQGAGQRPGQKNKPKARRPPAR